MFETPAARRRIGLAAWIAAWAGLLLGQVHAMARHRTTDGRQDLELALTRAWSDPARELFAPLLDWASADVVYLTWGKIWLPVFVCFTLCAFVVHRRRRPHGFETWAWRVALAGYVCACVSVAAEYWTQWGAMNDALLEAVFLATIPAMLLTMVGSTLLGIALLRGGVKLPGALLVLALPGVFVIPMVTSLGNVVLPIAFAFGVLGRRMAREEKPVAAPAARVAA